MGQVVNNGHSLEQAVRHVSAREQSGSALCLSERAEQAAQGRVHGREDIHSIDAESNTHFEGSSLPSLLKGTLPTASCEDGWWVSEGAAQAAQQEMLSTK